MLTLISTDIILTATAATASFVLSPLCCRLAHLIGALDVPRDSRRMHRTPIPRLGGLAIFIPMFSILCFREDGLRIPILIGSSLIFALGLSDDVMSLSPTVKLTAQAFISAVTLILSYDRLFPDGSSYIHMAFAFLWMILLTNAFNLIDGLDTLCSGVAAVSGIFLYLISSHIAPLLLSAALCGFLPHNRHPARIFLGDSGAMLSGFLLSVISLDTMPVRHYAPSLTAMIMIFSLPIFDTVAAFVRRLMSGRSPFSPDRLHLHHRLVDSGLSHSSAARLLIIFSTALASLGSMIFLSGLSVTVIICLFLIAIAALCLIPIIKKAP